MKEHSTKTILKIIKVLDGHVDSEEDVSYPTAAACSRFLKDVCQYEGVCKKRDF